MRMLIHVTLPPEPFNTACKNGTVGQTMSGILAEMKPEAVYFTEQCGQRGAFIVADVAGPSDIPRVCEPWFLKFNAEVKIRIAMTPQDLAKSGLEQLGKKWA
jgi:hypothetical protein